MIVGLRETTRRPGVSSKRSPTLLKAYQNFRSTLPKAISTKATRLRRFTLRMDGFVSIRADSQGGEMVTKPIVFSGNRLELNFSTSAAGLIQVEIQDAAGKPIPGFALEDCPEIFGNRINQVVAWKQGSDLSKLAGKPIRLRFVMKDADLYAIQFP